VHHQGVGEHQGPHSAMLGGHSTLNTVVLGEGVSKYQIPSHFGHHSSSLFTYVVAGVRMSVVAWCSASAGRRGRGAGAAMVAEVGGYLVL
jgi:hypothetical protein